MEAKLQNAFDEGRGRGLVRDAADFSGPAATMHLFGAALSGAILDVETHRPLVPDVLVYEVGRARRIHPEEDAQECVRRAILRVIEVLTVVNTYSIREDAEELHGRLLRYRVKSGINVDELPSGFLPDAFRFMRTGETEGLDPLVQAVVEGLNV